MAFVNHTSAPDPSGPKSPQITLKHIWDQFWIDISGKEVQSAETYSHSWVANQFGHVCVGLLLGGIATMAARWVLGFAPLNSAVGGAVLVAIVVALWEWRAYRIAVKDATGQFPLGRKLLRHNAIIAAIYMELGVATVFVYSLLGSEDVRWLGLPSWLWASVISLGFLLIGVALAVPWLRQKIIWQKAALPYVFRLADAPPVMHDDDARTLQELIDSKPPPEGPPRQIVIGGPFGSGRTSLATGIGTEFAFRKATVRYMSLAKLLEFAAQPPNPHFADDTGPANIKYWRWYETQVLIVDDIGPLVAPLERLHQIGKLLDVQLNAIREVLAGCHTVWLIGEPQANESNSMDEVLDQFAVSIGNFCSSKKNGREKVLVVQLERDVAVPVAPPTVAPPADAGAVGAGAAVAPAAVPSGMLPNGPPIINAAPARARVRWV